MRTPRLSTLAYAAAVLAVLGSGAWWWQRSAPGSDTTGWTPEPATVSEVQAMGVVREYFDQLVGLNGQYGDLAVAEELARLDPMLLEPGPYGAVDAGVGLSPGSYELHPQCVGVGELVVDLMAADRDEVLWSARVPCNRHQSVFTQPLLVPDDRFTSVLLRAYTTATERVVVGWSIVGRAAGPPRSWPERIRLALPDSPDDSHADEQGMRGGTAYIRPAQLPPGRYVLFATCLGTASVSITTSSTRFPGGLDLICDGRVQGMPVLALEDSSVDVSLAMNGEGAGHVRWVIRPGQ